MDRMRLYDAAGNPLNEFINKERAIAQTTLKMQCTDKMTSVWDVIVNTLNEEGKFLKFQLKGLKKGQVVVCKK